MAIFLQVNVELQMMECYKSCIIVSTFAELSCVSLYSDWLSSANLRYLNLVTCLSRLYLYQMESETPSDSSLRLAQVSHWWCLPFTLHPPYFPTWQGRCLFTLPIVFAAPCTGHFLPSFCLAHKGAFVLGWGTRVLPLDRAGRRRCHHHEQWPDPQLCQLCQPTPQTPRRGTRRPSVERRHMPSIPQLLGLHNYAVEVRAS